MNRRLGGPLPPLGRSAIVLQALAALAFVAVLLHAEGVRLPFTGTDSWTLTAQFSDAGGLRGGENIPVLVSGVPEGVVTGVRVREDRALVTIRLNAETRGAVRADAQARIEPRSALEDLTVDISPGSTAAPALRPGAQLAASSTQPATTLDQVVSVLDADTRAQLTIVLGALARGLHGRGGTLRAAIARLDTLLSPAQRVTGALARRRALLASLVGSLAGISRAAQAHDASIVAALTAGERTLRVTAHDQGRIRASLQALPATLRALTRALSGVRGLAQPLVPLLDQLPATAAVLPAALRGARRATPALAQLLSAARALAGARGIEPAARAISALAPTAAALTPAIADVRPVVSAVNQRRDGIAQLGERFSGVLSTDDANGPILRGLGSFEPFNPADFGYPDAGPAQRAALAAGAVKALTQVCLHDNPVACLVRYLVPGLPGAVR